MTIIWGSAEREVEKAGRVVKESVPLTCEIPDEPKSVSDFPKKVIAAIVEEPLAAPAKGLVGVITVDGKKFYVEPGKQSAPPDDDKGKTKGGNANTQNGGKTKGGDGKTQKEGKAAA